MAIFLFEVNSFFFYWCPHHLAQNLVTPPLVSRNCCVIGQKCRVGGVNAKKNIENANHDAFIHILIDIFSLFLLLLTASTSFHYTMKQYE